MILVTGGSGLVGGHLLLKLLESNEPIRAIYRDDRSIRKAKKIFSFYQKEHLIEQIDWFKADVTDIVALEKAFKDVRNVYHCAAMVSFRPKDRDRLIQVNIEGTANVVNLCLEHNVAKLCHVSSTAAIGNKSDGGMKEETDIWANSDDNSFYSVSKFYSEMEVWRGIEEGLNAVIVNPCIILGPGDWSDGSANLFQKIWKGLSYYTLGSNAFVDVRDVCEIMIRLMNSEISGERFLVISENMPFREVFNQIADALTKKRPSFLVKSWLTGLAWRIEKIKSLLFGFDPLITKETARSAVSHSSYSNRKVKDLLKFDFISVEDSIKDTSVIFLSDHS